ncbi:MAG: His-Xaa-Ser system radical SAM maturase HxsB [Lachnospiraceae bacterium]|nr:His-Xaa-Ser system radical SAM maturase HxsB [Lachnospiraceae bacterium]
MIAPFHFKKLKDRIIITNDLGRYAFLSLDEFRKFADGELDSESELYQKLKKNYFLYDTSPERYLEDIKPELRYGKSYLFSATSLHIFVVTNYCNAACIYCQAQSGSIHGCKKMTREVARKSVDLALQSPQKELSFEFQGGEPLSNFAMIRYIVEYTNSVNTDKIIHYSVVSNLSLLTEEMVRFFQEHSVSISTSLDGDRTLHGWNRPLGDGSNSYDILKQKLELLKLNGLGYGAIQTTTRNSLSRSKQMIDEYLNLGLDSIFIRPLTPLGYAGKRWAEIGYTTGEFLDFYRSCICYLLEVNRKGYFMREGHASIFLSKILNGYGMNYMELRSPCGAGIGQLAYYYDGNVFTCDEGRMLFEMGDASFKLGNVVSDDYDSLMNSKLCKTVCKYSIIESLPKCCDCAYQPYCGTCPVVNYALERDIISRSNKNYRCRIYEGMLDILFELLEDEKNTDILRRWSE